jgi:hypothetical protein
MAMLSIYPKSAIALVDARVVAVTWVLLALSGVAWVAQSFLGTSAVFAQSVFAAFVVSGLVHAAMSFRHSCPSCGKHPTIQGLKPPHPNSVSQSNASGWAGVIVNILRRRQLICVHCGTPFRIDA